MGVAQAVQPLHDAAQPVMESWERPAVRRPQSGLETNPEPRSRCPFGPKGDLSADCHPVYPSGRRGLPETGGKPAEIRKDSIPR